MIEVRIGDGFVLNLNRDRIIALDIGCVFFNKKNVQKKERCKPLFKINFKFLLFLEL